VPGSNGARAGLRAGDVLLRYQDTALKTLADLSTQIQAPPPDTKTRFPVQVWRAAETLTVEVLPGPLGVSVAREPAPEALARRRRIDAELVASRGADSPKALPGTRVEVAALARRFREARQPLTLLTDSDASEQRLAELAADGSLGKVRYLHLATHGTVDWGFHLQSAILLARDRLPDPARQLDAGLPVYDGRLTAAEMLRDWNLDAELVTLSACETGLGTYAGGEGYLGFAQALLVCGSRSVVLSLWPVDDAATALLMDRFYANLLGQRDGLTKGLGKAAALAEAKAWLRTLPRAEAVKRAAALTSGVERGAGREALPRAPAAPETRSDDEPPYAHPYYWAAFVLVGDPD
jgi:CHAT domain-containing protein